MKHPPFSLIFAVILLTVWCRPWLWTTHSTTTIASWYTGDKVECASRDYPVGTVLRVMRADIPQNVSKSILVEVTSRGPSLPQYHNGRHLDLSRPAFAEIADPDVGLVEVSIQPVSR